MTHSEILQKFFSRQHENDLLQQQLYNKKFDMPIDDIKNFMVSLTEISFTEFLNYIDNHPNNGPLNSADLTQFSALTACTDELCAFFKLNEWQGATVVEIGQTGFFQKYLRTHHKASWGRFGNNQAKTAHLLGLTVKNDSRWYLTCYGYVYAYSFLSRRQQLKFLTRALLRNSFYSKVLTCLRFEEVHIKDILLSLSASTLGVRSKSIANLLQLCLNEMNSEKIKWHDLYLPRYNTRKKELSEYLLSGTVSTMDNYTLADEYFEDGVPLYTVKAACGYFIDHEIPEQEGWMDLSDIGIKTNSEEYFVVHAKGDSMLPKIKDGDLCLFKWYRGEALYDNIVLTQCRDYDDEYESSYTIKCFHQNAFKTGESRTISLQPLNKDKYEPIVLSEEDGCDYKTIGVFVKVL